MAEIKALDQVGIDFLTNEEGLRLSPYLDVVGVPTIGYGNTYYDNGQKVTLKDPKITKERAVELFKLVVKHYETAVWSLTRNDINQNQFNALCSLAYNIGINGFKNSTVLKKVNKNPNDPTIAAAFEMWSKPKVLLGRRKREHKLYFS